MSNDYTKPSRIKRRLKRRWKKNPLSNLTYCSLFDYLIKLTAESLAAKMALLSQKTKAWFETQKNKNGAGYAPIKAHGFFYTLQKDAGLIRVLFLVMAGSVGAASVFAASQPDANRHPSFETLAGGNSKLKNGVTTMSQDQSAQNSGQTQNHS